MIHQEAKMKAPYDRIFDKITDSEFDAIVSLPRVNYELMTYVLTHSRWCLGCGNMVRVYNEDGLRKFYPHGCSNDYKSE